MEDKKKKEMNYFKFFLTDDAICNYASVIKSCKTKSDAGYLITAMIDYVTTGTEPELPSKIYDKWLIIRSGLKVSKNKSDAKMKQLSAKLENKSNSTPIENQEVKPILCTQSEHLDRIDGIDREEGKDRIIEVEKEKMEKVKDMICRRINKNLEPSTYPIKFVIDDTKKNLGIDITEPEVEDIFQSLVDENKIVVVEGTNKYGDKYYQPYSDLQRIKLPNWIKLKTEEDGSYSIWKNNILEYFKHSEYLYNPTWNFEKFTEENKDIVAKGAQLIGASEKTILNYLFNATEYVYKNAN